MSHLCTILELAQKHCDENPEIAELLNDIDKLHREKNQLETKLEELNREHVRLEMELYNVQLLDSRVDTEAIAKCNQTNAQIFEHCVDMSNLIAQIDFEKILKCHYMEMEEQYRKECEPIQECMARTLKWHEQMEERNVVKKYRHAEKTYKEAEAYYSKEQESMANTLKESSELMDKEVRKRNKIIVNLITESKKLKKLQDEMKQLELYEENLERLKKEKMDLTKQLESSQQKAFNYKPLVSYTPQDSSQKSSGNLQNFNFPMPALPSFMDILNNFQMKCSSPQTEITVIQNTTTSITKSILHNSQNSSMELNQSITTTNLTKQVHFKKQLEEYQYFTTYNADEMESEESTSESSQQTQIEVNEVDEERVENEGNVEDKKKLEETKNESETELEIETIDLLTPAAQQEYKLTEDIESPPYEPLTAEEHENKIVSLGKPKIEIQECIVFKAPLPAVKSTKPEGKENLRTSLNSSKTTFSDELPSSKDTTAKSSTATTSFYDEFLNASLSSESSSNTTTITKVKTNSKRSVLKDFDAYLNENKEFLSSSVVTKETSDSENDKLDDIKQQSSSSDSKQSDAAVKDNFLDFGSSNNMGFTFDLSDNNMDGNSGGGNVFDFFG